MIRTAIGKYVDFNFTGDRSDALKKLIDDSITPNIRKDWKMVCDLSDWKKTTHMVQEVDNVYKSYLPIINSSFANFAGSITGDKRFMSYEEFEKLLRTAELFNDNFSVA